MFINRFNRTHPSSNEKVAINSMGPPLRENYWRFFCCLCPRLGAANVSPGPEELSSSPYAKS